MNIKYKYSPELVSYPDALVAMDNHVAAIHKSGAQELLWFLEHPPLYTSGTSAKDADLLGSMPLPVYDAGRGGQWTYHGPGQRICYVMLDLKKRDMMDLRRYVKLLEQWIIVTLTHFGVDAFTREGRIGVWVNKGSGIMRQTLENTKSKASRPSEPSARPMGFLGENPGGTQNGEAKIAALGIRVRRWVTFHGIALNINPDLSHYAGIVPCGIQQYGVTSLHDMGIKASMEEVDMVLKEEFEKIFSSV